MNIAIILSTLLISASTPSLPGDNSQMDSPEIASPTSGLPLPPIQESPSAQQSKTSRSSSKTTAQQRNMQRAQERAARSSAGRSQQTNNQYMPPLMPFAPTDSSAGTDAGQYYQWLPPTASSSGGGAAASGGRPSGPFGYMNVPTSPTRARPGQPQSYSSMQTAELQNRRMQAARNASAAPPVSSVKPFTGYTPQGSGSSPYMNLFRTGNNNGTVDNYSTLVRPELDQRNANQQFGADIHSLEDSTHVQRLHIQQLNRDTQTLQGVNATQYFMNYGDYYPNATGR